MAEEQLKLSDRLAQKRTVLAAERTILAAERSLMAWIRTGLSMISFGFTIYKFLQYVKEDLAEVTIRTYGPRNIGLFLIGLGTACLLLGLLEYRDIISQLKSYGAQMRKFPVVLASLIGIMGLFLFLTIILNREVF